ncbi:MAG TPA: hypothetical protein VG709_02705 [Actinomycetota bacterium]|nr:hypothetical protein [Actinomycetota bacterium]
MIATHVQRFSIDYGVWRPLLSVLGLGPKYSRVELMGDALHVRMGWGFEARIPRSSIANPRRGRATLGIGAHTDLRGGWLVNGSLRGIVWMDVDPPARGRSMGIRVRVRRLGVGVDDPHRLIAELAARGPARS